ncbi:hypothetical protein [Neobacillus sp. Marseille-QA0830]
MTGQLKKITYEGMREVLNKGRKLFEKRGIIFIHTPLFSDPVVEQELPETKGHIIEQMHIEKNEIPALYENVTNGTMFQKLVISIMKEDTMELLGKLKGVLDQESIPEEVKRNIQIIPKYVIQFQKRLQMTLRTSFDECNDVAEVQEKAKDVLKKAFGEGLLSHVMPALLEGLKSSPNYYKYLINFFNEFIEQYGIYTKIYEVNQDVDYDYLELIPENTDNQALHGKIADLVMLPYFFNDQRYSGQAPLCAGQCYVWKFDK